MERVYLDWNATAPVWPEAVDAAGRAMRDAWGNASSLHEEGRRASRTADQAREALADWTKSRAIEWILTSGGTESIHAAINGCATARAGKKRIVTSKGEHSCTLGVCDVLERQGWEIVRVGLRSDGTWDPQEVLAASDPAVTALVSLIWANNETGAVSDVAALAGELRGRRVPFHLDAVQCLGRVPVDLSSLPVGLVSVSGHKFGAPKGIGALFVRQGAAWSRWMQGGNQERSRRGGTVNVPGAAGMAAAVACSRSVDVGRIESLRDGLQSRILSTVPDVRMVASAARRLPNTLCLCVPGCDSSTLLDRLDARGFAVSSGSACTTGVTDPSHVLVAMGMPPEDAHATIRVSIGPATEATELDAFGQVLVEEIAQVRGRAVAFQ